jgi:MFS superfamily sulfate permease-like transporter
MFKTLKNDLPAGIVVFLVAIPLCLGVAVASGVPEFSGIVAGVVGGIVIGLLSGSPLSVSGPAAGLTSIVSVAIMKLPAIDAFFMAVVVSGMLQLFLGWMKWGIIGDYIPNSVIKGMLAAIGIILILKQFPHLVGYDKDYEGDMAFIEISGENSFTAIIHSINHITPMAVLIGMVGLLILMAYESSWVKGKKTFQLISGPLVVVVVGVLMNQTIGGLESNLTERDAHLVAIPLVKEGESFLNFFHVPAWHHLSNLQVWMTGLTIALVASLETLLSIEAVDKLDPLKRATPPNRELLAQGTGNIVSGLLGGLPVTSVIVRSSANVNAGGRSKTSAIFHGMLILVSVIFFPDWLNMIPKAALAAILIFTGYKLANAKLFRAFYKKGWDQFMPFLITVVSIVMTDLLKGVFIGIAIGLFYVIRNNFRTAVISVENNGQYLIRIKKDVSFFIKPILKQKLEAIPEGSEVIIDLVTVDFMDADVIETIQEFMTSAPSNNITCSLQTNSENKHWFNPKN